MTYRQDNEQQKKRIRIFLSVIVIALVFFYQHKIFPGLFGGFSQVAVPVLSAGESLKENTGNGLDALFLFKSALLRENKNLKEKLAGAEIASLERDRLIAENLELRMILGRAGEEKILLANILARPNQSPYDILILDVGKNNGVSEGAPVLAYGNMVIGRVADVSDKSSRAVLFSSPKEENDGIIIGKNIPLKLTGTGGGNFTTKVPRGILVEKGDQVISIGLPSHILGVVEDVSVDPRDPYQSILLRSPVNIYELRFVEIVL